MLPCCLPHLRYLRPVTVSGGFRCSNSSATQWLVLLCAWPFKRHLLQPAAVPHLALLCCLLQLSGFVTLSGEAAPEYEGLHVEDGSELLQVQFHWL